jgi:hypothetical protein
MHRGRAPREQEREAGPTATARGGGGGGGDGGDAAVLPRAARRSSGRAVRSVRARAAGAPMTTGGQRRGGGRAYPPGAPLLNGDWDGTELYRDAGGRSACLPLFRNDSSFFSRCYCLYETKPSCRASLCSALYDFSLFIKTKRCKYIVWAM